MLIARIRHFSHCFSLTICSFLRTTALLLTTICCSTVALAAELNIITLGDSLTAGLNRTGTFVITCPVGVASEPDRYTMVNPKLVCYGNGAINKGGYQPFLQEMFTHDGHTPFISNFGFSGIRSDQMIGELSDALAMQPSADYILIMGGANDVDAGVSTSTVVANLSFIVEDAKSAGLIPVISTVIRDTRSAARDAKAGQYAQGIRDYANANQILLADPRSSMGVNWSSFHSGDGLHLKDTGNSQLSKDFYNALSIPRESLSIPAIQLLLLDGS